MTTDNPPKQRRTRRMGTPNKLDPALAAALAEDGTGAQWGPCMKALNDKQKAFVLSLYQIKLGHGAHVKAAKLAGYGTNTTTPQSWSVIASRLAHDDRILAALYEEDQKRIRASAPRAVRALQNLVETPEHRDHVRGIAMVLDRVHPAETHHSVQVHHVIDHNEEAIESLRAFKRLNVSREKLEELYGFSGLSRYERLLEERDGKQSPDPSPAAAASPDPRVIEATAVEIKPSR